MAAKKKVVDQELDNSESTGNVITENVAPPDGSISASETIPEDQCVEDPELSGPDLDEFEEEQETELASGDDLDDPETTSAINSILGSLPPEQRREFAILMRKISFRGHSVARASKKQMREMLHDEEVVHAMGRTSTYNSDAKKLKEDMTELAASAQSKRILSGVVAGMAEIESNSSVKQYKAKIRFGNDTCTVWIPDFVMFNFDYNNRLDPDIQKKVYQRISSMLGSRVDFIVKHWDVKTKTAYGDRLKAMEKHGWNYFVNENNPEIIRKGMLVEAEILAVRKADLIVSAMGVEARIPLEECGWAHYSDLNDEFKKGSVVAARVLNISRKEVEKAGGEKYQLIGLELSIRQASKDPREKYWNDYKEQELYVARVTAVDATVGVFIMLDNKVQALAAYPAYGNHPQVGDDVTVQVTEKVIVPKNDGTKEYRIFCVFKRL